MLVVKQTDVFTNWIRALKDRIARSVINARVRQLSIGNKGDSRNIGDGVSELRIDMAQAIVCTIPKRIRKL